MDNSNVSEGEPKSRKRKSKSYPKEYILSAAWSSLHNYRTTRSKKYRRYGQVCHACGSDQAAYKAFDQSITINPCDPIARLCLAKEMRDICDLVGYEEMLRGCITIAGDISETDKEIKAGWSALNLLALLLCQQERNDEAKKCLELLGFQYRLSRSLLSYNLPKFSKSISIEPPKNCGVKVFDEAFPPNLFNAAFKAFRPNSAFWREHRYHDPSVGYFSYVLSLKKQIKERRNCLIEEMVEQVKRLLTEWIPELEDCESAEFWAHCRCHSSGHQMHFDSAFEGETEGGAQNPICSTVLYLAGGVGGPTLVTNQSLKDRTMASDGFLVHPKTNRLTAFKGDLLHGVLPGRGVVEDPSSRRITLMVAFWPKMKTFPYVPDRPSAAQELPLAKNTAHTWPRLLLAPAPLEEENVDDAAKESGLVEPVFPVWELVSAPPAPQPTITQGIHRKRQLRVPIAPYELCFQGF